MKQRKIETGGFNPIPVTESFKRLRNDPEFMKAYDALEDEFNFLDSIVSARRLARRSQSQIASKMQTSQTAVARLESGRGNPSLKTLQRYAAATGTKLRITFEPVAKKGRATVRPARQK